MKEVLLTITENLPLTRDVYRMALSGDVSDIRTPGQFVNLLIPGTYLRRPISVCDLAENALTLIYRVVGTGTERLSSMEPGETLNVITGLGNGYDLSRSGERPVLVGGGVGIPPLLLLARRLLAEGKKPSVVLGFNRREDIFLEDAFTALGLPVTVTTMDGSYGVRGLVTDALPADATYFYACGPLPMLRALSQATPLSGQLSFEARMGCGFGACMGCSMQTANGPVRICREGPVLDREVILWDE